MDTRKWKKVLLQWITQCGFMERNYFNIEQSDIDTFFQNYYRHLDLHRKGGSPSGRVGVDLATFLQEHYPTFNPHFDDNYVLSSGDYVYVYSLLLHFSCVKYPQEYFHEICQKLPEQSQQNIANFFKLLLDCTNISKETIRHAIAEVASQCSPSSANNSFTSSSAEPAIKTPKRPSSQRVSPSTPKTYLLEERTRELYNLRALLETERYEKGLLEVQVKQNEEKILKLNQDHKKLQQHIQELRNDILNTEAGNSLERDEDEQHIKRRLCKEISQKEQEVAKLTDILNTLREEKSLFQEKLSYANKQIVACMDRIKELDCKVDELSTELEQKNGTIKYLTDNKLELEQFIAETRASRTNTRPDFNSSLDCLDASFSRTSNSSGSQSSPENLAKSVIDVQLREKELENQQLRETLTNMRLGNNRLAKHIQQTTQQHAIEWEMNIENVVVNDGELADPSEYFVIFANCVDKLSKDYKNEHNAVMKLQQEALALQTHNATLYQRVQQFEKDVGEMKYCVKAAQELNEELDESKKQLHQKYLVCEEELDLLKQEKKELSSKFESLTIEYEAHKISCQLTQKEFSNQLGTLQAELVSKTKQVESLDARNKQLEQTNSEFQTKLNALYDRLQSATTEYDLELKSLNERLESKEQELRVHISAEVSVKEKYEKLLIHCEDMKQRAREADQHLEATRNEIAVKEMEMKKLGAKINAVNENNSELEVRLDTLMVNHTVDLQKSDIILNKKNHLIKVAHSEKLKLKQQLEEIKALYENNQSETKKIEKKYQEMTAKLLTLQMLLTTPPVDNEEGDHSANSCDLDSIIEKVKQIIEERNNEVSRFEALQLSSRELKEQLRDAEIRLREIHTEKEELIDEHRTNLMECKTEVILAENRIQGYETQLEILKREQSAFIENLERHLAERSDDMSLRRQQEERLKQLEEERKAENDDYARLERELILVLGEHNDVKSKLVEAEKEVGRLQHEMHKIKTEHSDKVNEFSQALQHVETENTQLLNDINKFKKDHEHIEELLNKANSAVEDLSGQLTAEKEEKRQLNETLKEKEESLLESEKKMQSIKEENACALKKLQTEYDNHVVSYKATIAKMENLVQTKSKQAAEIEELRRKLEKFTKEKCQLHETYTALCRQVEREQSEKSALLRSLENTADQLRLAADEKSKHAVLLEQRFTELKTKYDDTVSLHERLKMEMVSKEAEWTLQLDELESKRNDMHSKLMRKITEQEEEQETVDITLIEIITVLEKISQYDNIPSIPTDFIVFKTVDEGDETTHHNQLKVELNKLMHQIAKLQQQATEAELKRKEAVDYVEVLTKANGKLNAELIRNKSEIDGLKNLLESKEKSAEKSEMKFNNEVRRLSEDLQNTECIRAKLSVENADLQFKIVSCEEELAQAKQKVDVTAQEQKKVQYKFSQECSAQAHYEIRQKAERISSLEEELFAANESSSKLKKQLQKLQQQISSHQHETSELYEKIREMQEGNGAMEAEQSNKKEEFAALEEKIVEAATVREKLEEQCRTAGQRLDEAMEIRVASENKYDALKSQMHLLKEEQLRLARGEQEKLNHFLEESRSEKQALTQELKEVKRELQRAMDNITELIQQVSAIRLEKESAQEENQLLRKQINGNGKNQSGLESKLKTLQEGNQLLRRQLEENQESQLDFASKFKPLKEENQLLRKQLNENQENQLDFESKLKTLQEENQLLREQLDENQENQLDFESKLKPLQEENQLLREQLDENQENQLDFESKLKPLQEENQLLCEQLDENQENQLDFESKLKTLQEENQLLREQLDENQENQLDFESKLKPLQEENQLLRKQLEENQENQLGFESKFKTLQEENQLLREQLDENQENQLDFESKKPLQEENQLLRKQLEENQENQLGFESKLKTLQEENQLLREQLDENQENQLDFESKLKPLQEENQLLRKQLEENQENQLGFESKFKTLQEEIQLLREQLDENQENQLDFESKKPLQEENQLLRKQLEENQENQLGFESKLKTLQEENQLLREQLGENQENQLDFESKLKPLQEENQLLRKQLDENQFRLDSDSKLKSMMEHSLSLEVSLQAAEDDLKSIRAHLEKSEQNFVELTFENKKVHEANEAATKRIEKLALKLGDVQARNSKLEREREKLSKTIEANNNSLDSLQRERDSLQNENKSLKDRLLRAERSYEQLRAKLQSLEKTNALLKAANEELDSINSNTTAKILKLERMRQMNEDKIRKLEHEIHSTEQANVRLNLEIGALNSEVREVHRTASSERLGQAKELQEKLLKAEEHAQLYEKRCIQLEEEVKRLQAENSAVSAQLSEVSSSLLITKDKYDSLDKERNKLRNVIEAMRAEKQRFEAEYNASAQVIKQKEDRQKSLLAEQQALVAQMERTVTNLKTDLASKSDLIVRYEAEMAHLRERLSVEREENEDYAASRAAELEDFNSRLSVAEGLLEKEKKASAQLRADNQILQAKYQDALQRLKAAELDDFNSRLSVAEGLLEKEKKASAQLRADNQILQAKYQDALQRLVEESRLSEERIKDNRLELEGKLEKMKAKMKTLYTEEVSKMKLKQEREISAVTSDLEALKLQNTKYEEHTRKLSGQIMRLNDTVLEYKKQNAILSTKLKHLSDNVGFKKPSSAVQTSSTTLAAPAANIGSNLTMEDEEGEVFNNTYLADLKSGRMSDFMSRNVGPEELQYRNSLLPPHLQSAYAAQYDHGLSEEDLKDNLHSFDDSMSALLSNTLGGTRKKVPGATSYKRPGPPTPSKNGGRLSLGGSSEPHREILKEFNDNNVAAVTSVKTPARFKLFSSRFSMGNSNPKDESVDLRKAMHKKNFRIIQTTGAGAVCTSTPRKSKSHFDQRRLLDQMLNSSPTPTSSSSTFLNTAPNSGGGGTCASKQKQHAVIGMRPRNRRSSIIRHNRSRRYSVHKKHHAQNIPPPGGVANADGTSSPHPFNMLCCCPSETTSSECLSASDLRRLRRRPQRERSSRPSLTLRSNIFCKNRTRTRSFTAAYRDLARKKARRQRMDNFNNYRMLKENRLAEQQCMMDDGSKKDSGCSQNRLGKTIVIARKGQEEMGNSGCVQGAGISTYLPSVEFSDGADPDDYEEIDSGGDDLEFQDEDTSVVDGEAITNSTSVQANNEPLVTTLELIEFEKRSARRLQLEEDESTALANSKYFEQVLSQTESQAPFEVKKLNFELAKTTKTETASELVPLRVPPQTNATIVPLTTTLSASSLALVTQNSPSVSSSYNSRTIYGGSVIYNHKIPYVNTTYVRKSSIYIKQKDSDQDIILVTNQTITLLDLARMWAQMDVATRFVLSFVVFGSFIAFIGLAMNFFS